MMVEEYERDTEMIEDREEIFLFFLFYTRGLK